MTSCDVVTWRQWRHDVTQMTSWRHMTSQCFFSTPAHRRCSNTLVFFLAWFCDDNMLPDSTSSLEVEVEYGLWERCYSSDENSTLYNSCTQFLDNKDDTPGKATDIWFVIDSEAGEIIRFVASVCLSVHPSGDTLTALHNCWSYLIQLLGSVQ